MVTRLASAFFTSSVENFEELCIGLNLKEASFFCLRTVQTRWIFLDILTRSIGEQRSEVVTLQCKVAENPSSHRIHVLPSWRHCPLIPNPQTDILLLGFDLLRLCSETAQTGMMATHIDFLQTLVCPNKAAWFGFHNCVLHILKLIALHLHSELVCIPQKHIGPPPSPSYHRVPLRCLCCSFADSRKNVLPGIQHVVLDREHSAPVKQKAKSAHNSYE